MFIGEAAPPVDDAEDCISSSAISEVSFSCSIELLLVCSIELLFSAPSTKGSFSFDFLFLRKKKRRATKASKIAASESPTATPITRPLFDDLDSDDEEDAELADEADAATVVDGWFVC